MSEKISKKKSLTGRLEGNNFMQAIFAIIVSLVVYAINLILEGGQSVMELVSMNFIILTWIEVLMIRTILNNKNKDNG